MQSTWDLNRLYWDPPGFRYYFLFLLFVWGVTGMKTLKLWRTLKRVETRDWKVWAAHNSDLRTSVTTFLHWMGLTLLVWGLFVSVSVGETSARVLAGSAKENIQDLVLLFAGGYAATLTMTLITAIVLYLLHWWSWKKIEKIAQDKKA